MNPSKDVATNKFVVPPSGSVGLMDFSALPLRLGVTAVSRRPDTD